MKKQFPVLLIIFLLTFFLHNAVWADQALVTKLVAGQNLDIGNVSIWKDSEHLYIKYETTGDWVLSETHLHLSDSIDSIPQRNGNPTPGKFDYKTDHYQKAREYIYEVDLSALLFFKKLYIAAHASVELLDQYGDAIQEDSAWGYGDLFLGKNWATYFAYGLVPPSPEEVNDALSKNAEASTTFEVLVTQVGMDQARQTVLNSLLGDPSVESAFLSGDGTTICITYTSGLKGGILTLPENTKNTPNNGTPVAGSHPEFNNAATIASTLNTNTCMNCAIIQGNALTLDEVKDFIGKESYILIRMELSTARTRLIHLLPY